MKIAILTMFNGLSNTYSLVNVVESHLNIFLDKGLDVKVLVSEDCPDNERFGVFADERVEWVKVTNRYNGDVIRWRDYTQTSGNLHDTFYGEVDCVANDFEHHLKDVDVCFMHDILYQGWHYLHNIAIRKAQKQLPNTRFVSFTHSFPINRPSILSDEFAGRFTKMDNTIFAYPTHSGLPALAKQYNVGEGLCRAIYNINPIFLGLSEEVIDLHKKVDLLSPEILIVYPARLTTGKQFEKVAMVAGAIKRYCEKSVKIIFCDFKSMDVESEMYKKEITCFGVHSGLSKEDIVFTSLHGYTDGFPRNAVLDLFTLSNLYICPSFSESFGLTVIEASSRGNFIVLNQAVPALEEVGKNINAYFMRWNARNFGFDTTENYIPSEELYNKEHAEIIINKMRENPVLTAKTKARTMYSDNWVWKNQLEPLIFN